jgi:ABC-2 type transport system permease protein
MKHDFFTILKNVMRREWKRIVERKTIYLFTIFMPMLFFLFFAYIYVNGILRNIPVAVFDEDNSEISRIIIRGIDATSGFNVTEYVNSTDEIKNDFRQGKIRGAFYIPRDLERNLKRGKETSVVVFSDASNLIVSNTTLKEASTVIKTISGGILMKKLRSSGMQTQQAMNIISPIRIETQALYNFNYNYLNYLISGLLPVLLQMIIMTVAVLLISSEFVHHTINDLLETAEENVWAIIWGKSLPHLILHAATVLGLAGIIFPLFGMEIIGSTIGTILFLLFFVCVSFFFGLMISAVFHDQQFATEVSLFINVPAFIFSGFIFPLWAVPFLHSAFAQMIPSTHFIPGFLKIYQMGAPVWSVWPEMMRLTAFLGVSITIVYVALKYQIRRHQAVQLEGSAAQ